MKQKQIFYLILILLGAALFRAGYLLAPHMDADQAIFGLVGWHILQGEFPIFQWGFHYMGTLQSYMDALFFALFGMNRVVLSSVTLVLSLIFICVTYLLTKELLDKKTALVASLLSAFGPYYLVFHGAWARHGYQETMIFGSLLMLMTTKLIFSSPTSQKQRSLFIWFGLIAGLAWWTNFLIVYYLLPCGLFLWFKNIKLPLQRNFYLMVLAFFIGSSPFWIYNFSHSFASFDIFFKSGDVDVWRHMVLFFQFKLPVILGVRERTDWGWALATYALYTFALIWLLTRKHPRTLILPAVFVLVVFFLQSLSFYGNERTERHLLPLYSVLPILIARAFMSLKEKSRMASYALLTALLVLNVADNALSLPWIHKERINRYQEDTATKKRMIQTLVDKNIYGAYCHSYWVGPPLTFDSQEKVVFPHPFIERNHLLTRRVDGLWDAAYLTVGGNRDLEKSFESLNLKYEKFNAAPFVFYSFFQRMGPAAEEIDKSGWKCFASSNSEHSTRVVDQNFRSTWMSSTRQTPGMTFTIELPKKEKLCRIEMYLGNASRGVARKIKLALSRDGKKWKEVENVPNWWGYFWDGTHPFHHGNYGRTEIAFEATIAKFIRLELEEPNKSNPDYWAFAEISLYRSLNQPPQQIKPTQVKALADKLSQFPHHQIYASTWHSAHLLENYPKLQVANTWEAPIRGGILNDQLFKFSKPVVFVTTDENKTILEETLKNKVNASYQRSEVPPYTLFVVSKLLDSSRWYWTGKQLFSWKRVTD